MSLALQYVLNVTLSLLELIKNVSNFKRLNFQYDFNNKGNFIGMI